MGTLVTYLKKLPSGPVAVQAIKMRTRKYLEDPMATRVLSLVPDRTDVLDVGCHGGWLYAHLGSPKEYIGIDRWPEAIQAAKELFPEGDFRVCSLFDFKERVPFVFCSQIVWGKEHQTAGIAFDNLKEIGEEGIFISPRNEIEQLGVEFETFGSLGVVRW